MKNIVKFLLNPLFISVIGLCALGVVIWFAGPLIAFNETRYLESETARLIAILAVTLIWGLNNFRLQNQQKKKDSAMMGEIAQVTNSKSVRNSEESQVLHKHFQDALRLIRRSKKQSDKSGARGLHELPWYIIIGPPGSGKTTALINSGLRFPLAEQMGQQPLKGIGGTRNCDWWFSDEAVLIDTAGRYTTQDSNQATDSEAWSGFLKLLRKHRPRQPINGVILSISLSELMMQSESERKQHAHTIKQRLQELYENLGIQFPVYVLFTKCDLIAGFNEYFDNLSSQERQQIWGMTFPTSDKLESQFNLNNFKEEFDALLRRLNDRLQWRLQEERDVSRRALILGFPSELAALKEMTCQLLDATFRPGNFDNTVNLRGVYFTSGTQEGTPIDRVMGSLAHNFGLDRQTVPSYSGQGKSFFLTQLFRHVIFPEAMLAGTNRAHEKKQSWIRRAAYSLALLTTVAATGLWTSQYTEINSEILAIDQYADEYEQAFSKVSQSNDPSALLTPLAILQRAQSSGIENRSIFSQSGLSQMHALGPATDDAYHRTLQQAFFPRLINLLEAALNQRENNLDNVFAALKTYLMLAYTEHFDEQQVSQWFVNYWENQFPGNIDKQTQLQQHLKTLFHIGFEPILINEALVKNSRKKLQKIPLANRIYRSLKQKGKNTLADFFLADILYAEEQPFYLNKQDSNEPLRGIPGLFTKAGYESLFLEESVKLAQATRQDDWIFGKGSAGEKEKIDTDALHKEVEALYIEDFEKHWRALFANIKMSRFKDLEQSLDQLDNLAGDKSSLLRVLETINLNTNLRNKPNLLQQAGANKLKKLGGVGKKLAKSVKSDVPLTSVGKTLRSRFSKLIALTESVNGKPAQLQRHLITLLELQRYLSDISVSADPGVAALNASIARMKTNGKDVIGQLRRDSKRLPKPVNQWFKTISSSSWQLLLTASRRQLNTEWDNQIVTDYDQSMKNRYPLFRNSTQETSLEDFSNFFAADGKYLQFLRQKIYPFLKISSRKWSLKKLNGQTIKFTRKTLKQLSRGVAISNAFFPKNAEDIGVKFRLKPLFLDAKVKRFTLLLGDNKVTYRHGPARSQSLQWPFSEDPESNKVSMRFESSGNKTNTIFKGSWAIFKLLDAAKIKSTKSADKYQVTFTGDSYTAKYEFTTNSVNNPFNLPEIHAFRIPRKL